MIYAGMHPGLEDERANTREDKLTPKQACILAWSEGRREGGPDVR